MIDINKIKAIVFDWGGVCCKEGELFASLDLQQTLALTPEQIASKAKDIYNAYYIGKYNKDGFWRAIIKFFGLEETSAINPNSLSNAYLNSYSLYPEVLEIVGRLRNKYKTGLLSNLTPEMRDNIRAKHNLQKYFDVEIYSCDLTVVAMKPGEKPYHIILEKLGVAATESLFIDNSIKNIQAASALGFETIFFNDLGQFLKEIEILL
ncbi:MAG: HAD family phosphatase [Candidatus Staskawiczbacteria bacterium]|nr:HAD family phosphatase [Candidatus Staskawiczbacteria bacterium]